MKRYNCTAKRNGRFSFLFFLSGLLFIGIPLCVQAQHYNFKTYSIEEGLSQSVVYAICQDDFGFLWFGTNGGGVDRFDGKDFKNYTVKDGLSDNVVNCIIKDRFGNLWICTDNGLSKYDIRQRRFSVYGRKEGLNHPRVWSAIESSDGFLWLALYSGGAAFFDPGKRRFKNFTARDGLNDDNVRSIREDRDGNIWLGTLRGVSKYKNGRFITDALTRRLAGHKVYAILEDSKGRVWFGTDKGVVFKEGNSIYNYTIRDGLCDNTVKTVLEDHQGEYWFGTTAGVTRFDGRHFTTYTTREGLSYSQIEVIYEDFEANVWFGTQMALSQYKRGPFTYIGEKDGLKDGIIWSIWQDRKGVVWFATEKGVAKFSGKHAPIITETRGFAAKTAYPFFEDRNGNLWFSADKKIVKYDGARYSNISKRMGIGDYEVYSILQDKYGSFWFGTRNSGLINYDEKKNSVKWFNKADGLKDLSINTIAEDHLGNIWAGTNDGIAVYDSKTRTFYNITTDDGLNNRYVTCFLKDHDRNLWFGTYGGGFTKYTFPRNLRGREPLKKGRFETFTTSDGLLDDEVLLMIFDNTGNLWVGTNKGISTLDIERYKKSGKKQIRNYDENDGFIGIECNQNAVYKDKEGCLWFGTIKGAIKYDPREDIPNPVEVPIHITGLRLFLEDIDWSGYPNVGYTPFGLPLDLELPYSKNHLTFEFKGINLTAPERVKYQVKLEGFDKNWSPVSSTDIATYSNLPPGDYTFKIMSVNNSGVWNKEPTAYRFRIKAPFWKLWWFYVLVGLFVFGSIFTLYKRRTRNLMRYQKHLEKQIRLHTLELHKEKQKVEQANLELEQRVEERTRKLAIANTQLMQAQKMEAIGTLAGGVAHDLNNILAGIVSYPELLLLKIPDDSPLRKYVETIKKSGEKAAAIVQDLLTLARRGVAVIEVVNLNQVISDFMKSPELNNILSYHPGARIETRLEEKLKNILGSPVHLSKTLMNLVTNAVEAMPGGGDVTIVTENCRIREPIPGYDEVEPGKYVLLQVKDTGIGIFPEDIDKIFEPFYTKKKMGKSGTGLGMAVVWATVKDHNGYITVESSKEEGTVFSLYLPVTRKKMQVDAQVVSIDKLKGSGETILVVDDIPEQREVSVLMLSQLGYEAYSVSNGEAAVEFVKDHPVDLLVLDMIMDHGINGLETYKRILKLYPGQKAVIISGFTETTEVRRAQKLGAGTYIKKPFGLEKIGIAVKNELEK
jgi:ligand-binding sensor domain-containing protein/signal transduction histidine kinase/CheY-like chemotaxis protein